MSSGIELVATTFTGKDGITSYGYRIYDDYMSVYDNYMSFEQYNSMTDMELMDYVIEKNQHDDNARDCFVFLKDNKCGITINGKYYDFDEIDTDIIAKIK